MFKITRNKVLLTVGGIVLLGVGAAAGSSGQHTVVKTVAGPVKTVTKTVDVPSGIKTVTRTVKVPGPTVTKTVYVPASQGPTGTEIARYSGSGNQNTGSFNPPPSGDFTVKWTFSGNGDGAGSGSNFIMSDTDSAASAMGLPNAIGTSGSGSTEVTGASGTESFNVQAAGQWVITVISAP